MSAGENATGRGESTNGWHSPEIKDEMVRELGADEIVRDGKSLKADWAAPFLLTADNFDVLEERFNQRDRKRFRFGAHNDGAGPFGPDTG